VNVGVSQGCHKDLKEASKDKIKGIQGTKRISQIGSYRMALSIVIPAYNEEENLPRLLDALLKRKKELGNPEIIITDDASKDRTGTIADSYAKKHRFIRAIHRKKGINGMGAALKDGTRAAKGDIIVWLMGDNSDDLQTIPKMIEKIKEGNDVVFGSRYMAGGSSGDLEPVKALLSSGYTRTTRFLFGLKVHDITNAFRAFKKSAFNSISLSSNDFGISPEFAIKATLKNLKLAEVPTTYKNRKAGQTKFRLLKMGLVYLRLFKYAVGSK
jgi:dolichol-phosphate mannosyltransferase